jgi:hypothetical protein
MNLICKTYIRNVPTAMLSCLKAYVHKRIGLAYMCESLGFL